MSSIKSGYGQVRHGATFFELLTTTLMGIAVAGELKALQLDETDRREHSRGATEHLDQLILMDETVALAVSIVYAPPAIHSGRGQGWGGLAQQAATTAGDIGSRLKGAARALVNPDSPKEPERTPVQIEGRWTITVRSPQATGGAQFSGTVFEEDKIEAAFVYIIDELAKVRATLSAKA